MSFILDALKKIEEDKRRGEAQQPSDAATTAKKGRASSRRVLFMIGIAIASAALTASLLVLGRGAEDPRSTEVSAARVERAGGLDSESVVPDETPVSEPASTDTPERSRPAPPIEPALAPPGQDSVNATARAEVKTSRPSAAPSTPQPSRAPAPVATEQLVVERTDEQVETSGEESTAAFRLVGKESPRLYGEPMVSVPAEDEPGGESEGDEVSLPGHFPKLVLQGTSVINGEPVAVINDQRVFEGDSVEGARVLGIEERVVELELEGVRFKIQL